jgi:hypothetical protein
MEIILNNIVLETSLKRRGLTLSLKQSVVLILLFLISQIIKKVHGINEFRKTYSFINGYVVGMAVTVMAYICALQHVQSQNNAEGLLNVCLCTSDYVSNSRLDSE